MDKKKNTRKYKKKYQKKGIEWVDMQEGEGFAPVPYVSNNTPNQKICNDMQNIIFENIVNVENFLFQVAQNTEFDDMVESLFDIKVTPMHKEILYSMILHTKTDESEEFQRSIAKVLRRYLKCLSKILIMDEDINDEKMIKRVKEFYLNSTIMPEACIKYLLVLNLLYCIGEEISKSKDDLILGVLDQIIETKSMKGIAGSIVNLSERNNMIKEYGGEELQNIVKKQKSSLAFEDKETICLLALYVRRIVNISLNVEKYNSEKKGELAYYFELRKVLRRFCNRVEFTEQMEQDIQKILDKENFKLNNENYGMMFITDTLDVSENAVKKVELLKKYLITVSRNNEVKGEKKPRTSIKELVPIMYKKFCLVNEKKMTAFSEVKLIKEFEKYQEHYLGTVSIDLKSDKYLFENKKGSLAYNCNMLMIMLFMINKDIPDCEYLERLFSILKEVHDNGYVRKITENDIDKMAKIKAFPYVSFKIILQENISEYLSQYDLSKYVKEMLKMYLKKEEQSYEEDYSIFEYYEQYHYHCKNRREEAAINKTIEETIEKIEKCEIQ